MKRQNPSERENTSTVYLIKKFRKHVDYKLNGTENPHWYQKNRISIWRIDNGTGTEILWTDGTELAVCTEEPTYHFYRHRHYDLRVWALTISKPDYSHSNTNFTKFKHGLLCVCIYTLKIHITTYTSKLKGISTNFY